MRISREWVFPVVVPAAAGAIWCAMFGPVVAAGMLVGCAVIGGPLARWAGRKMFGNGGQE